MKFLAMKYITLLSIFITSISISSHAQLGSLEGFVVDKTSHEDLGFVDIAIYHEDQLVTGNTTAIDGFYSIQLPPGSYTMIASCLGYQSSKRIPFKILEDQITSMDLNLRPGILLPQVVITSKGITRCAEGCVLYGTVSAPVETSSSTSRTNKNPESKYKKQDNLIQRPTVYPNPSSGTYNIIPNNNFEITKWTIVDKLGKQVAINSDGIVNNQFDISHHVDGNYHFIYQSESGDLQSLPIIKLE